MKLYTEEQVRQAYNAGFIDGYEVEERCEESAISVLTPIELPSDEEIVKISFRMFNWNDENMYCFQKGAKWIKEQILNQSK